MKRMKAREMIIIRHLMLGMLFVTDFISIFKINDLIQVFEYDHANRYTKSQPKQMPKTKYFHRKWSKQWFSCQL